MSSFKGNSPGFPSWEERFSGEEYIYGEEANKFLQEASRYLPASSEIAAYAEGEGRNAVFLAQQGHEVTAYDYAQAGLRKTEALAAKHGVRVKTAQVDLIEAELPVERYDAAVVIFGHFADEVKQHVLDSILGSLKPGGLLIMEVYEKEQIHRGTGGPKDVNWLYSATELLAWSKRQQLRHFYTGEAERHEGRFHTGRCCVVQVVLQKKE